MATQKYSANSFWEMKARKYPLPFDPENLAKTKAMITLTESRGVCPDGATILDIGCGTGTYTLPLAQVAEKITGVDSSATMLERLRQEAKQAGLDNVSTVEATWQDGETLARH
jgi:ubiquinone/menaquinone biosynthesis C-methylase UbiE